MNGNYGFDENEGFVGSVDDFNGIVFCLREPHITSKNEASKEKKQPKEFWFQRIVNEKEKYYQQLREEIQQISDEQKALEAKRKMIVNKRVGTRFKNEFAGILRQIKSDESISNIAFCNINAGGGGESAGKVYQELLKCAHEKIEKIIVLNPRNQLCIFTCVDIYETLKNAWKNKYKIVEAKKGVRYKSEQGQKHCFTCQIANKEVTIFEIYHPSRRGYPLDGETVYKGE